MNSEAGNEVRDDNGMPDAVGSAVRLSLIDGSSGFNGSTKGSPLVGSIFGSPSGKVSKWSPVSESAGSTLSSNALGNSSSSLGCGSISGSGEPPKSSNALAVAELVWWSYNPIN